MGYFKIWLGNRNFKNGDFQKAISDYEKALEYSKNPLLSENILKSLYASENYEELLKEEHALHFQGGNSLVKIGESMGAEKLKEQKENYEKALLEYKKSLLTSEDINIKKNYEIVLERLKEQENQNQQSQDQQQDKNNDQKNENKQDEQKNEKQDQKNDSEKDEQNSKSNNSKDKNEQKNNDQNQDSKDNQNDQDQQNSEDKDQQKNSEENNKDKKENDQEKNNADNDKNNQNNKNKEQKNEQNNENKEEQQDQNNENQPSGNSNGQYPISQEERAQEELQYMLKKLEGNEKQAFKNNEQFMNLKDSKNSNRW